MVRWVFRLAVVMVLLVCLAVGLFFHEALYRRFYTFPKQAQAWERIRSERTTPSLQISDYVEYRGMMHSHSELSHDSCVPFPEILAALKQVQCNFIFMSDHCDQGKADYSKGWAGLHDGVLFVRGFEMDRGFTPWGLPEDTILENGSLHDDNSARAVARKINELGGVLFYIHCEEPRIWDIPELTGMELHNLHVDFKRVKLGDILPDIVFSLRAYPDQVMRSLFHREDAVMTQWDNLNRTGSCTGIGGNDSHQNCGYHGVFTPQGTFQIIENSKPDALVNEFKPGVFGKLALRIGFGPLEPNRELFRVSVDPYERSARFVNTHIFAKELTQPALLEALRKRHVFVAFEMLADARGFVFLAEGQQNKCIMGDTIPMEPGLYLKAASPLPGRFRLVRDGVPFAEKAGTAAEWEVPGPGSYRVEVDLDQRFTGASAPDWVDWIYANPITITAQP